MNNSEFSVPLVGYRELGLPFVSGFFREKGGKLVPGVFLVDCCSMSNVLNHKLLQYVDCSQSVDVDFNVMGSQGNSNVRKMVDVEIELGRELSTETFNIVEGCELAQMFGKGVIGILGLEYILHHGLVLDFANKCLTSKVEDVERVSPSFLMLMRYGLEAVGLPAVVLSKDEEEFIYVVDSGCNLSTVTLHGLNRSMYDTRDVEGRMLTMGIVGETVSRQVEASFQLCSMGVETGEVYPIESRSRFLVEDNKEYMKEPDEDGTPAIYGLIGVDYMLKHGWVLDFAQLLIYAK